jgi:hypothetical protein
VRELKVAALVLGLAVAEIWTVERSSLLVEQATMEGPLEQGVVVLDAAAATEAAVVRRTSGSSGKQDGPER